MTGRTTLRASGHAARLGHASAPAGGRPALSLRVIAFPSPCKRAPEQDMGCVQQRENTARGPQRGGGLHLPRTWRPALDGIQLGGVVIAVFGHAVPKRPHLRSAHVTCVGRTKLGSTRRRWRAGWWQAKCGVGSGRASPRSRMTRHHLAPRPARRPRSSATPACSHTHSWHSWLCPCRVHASTRAAKALAQTTGARGGGPPRTRPYTRPPSSIYTSHTPPCPLAAGLAAAAAGLAAAAAARARARPCPGRLVMEVQGMQQQQLVVVGGPLLCC